MHVYSHGHVFPLLCARARVCVCVFVCVCVCMHGWMDVRERVYVGVCRWTRVYVYPSLNPPTITHAGRRSKLGRLRPKPFNTEEGV